MNKNLLVWLLLLAGSSSVLSSAPLGTPPQFSTEKKQAEKAEDGQSIVLGKFKSRQDADVQLSSLLDFMDSSPKMVSLELKHGFDYAVKDENGLYIVSIEPFVDNNALEEVLQTVSTHYPNASVEVCKGCVRESFRKAQKLQQEEQEQELLENAIALDETKEHVKIPVEEDASVDETVEKGETPKAQGSMSLPIKKEYILYGLGALALVILLFLIMRKPKKTSDTELRELYAEAQKLEQEMSDEDQGKAAAQEVETASVEEVSPQEVKKEAPENEMMEPEVQPVPEVVKRPETAPEPVKAPEPAKEEVASGELSHKLREPNNSIGTITKDNFKEFEGLRLLIAEDNLINQKVIVGLLKDSGINIKIANDGQECLDILAEDPNYPIILMDAHMPRVDGLEATRQIRANPAYNHITVMALSGDTGADDIRKMRDCGMEEQLEKPLKIAALYQALYCYFDPSMVAGAEEELPEIHLDNSLGLEMLGGDIELYHEILAEFQTLYHDSDEKLDMWLKHGDYDRAKALLLDVKGLGESIGTAELTETAEEFREVLIAGQSDQYQKLLKRYSSQLKAILADIAEV